MKALDIISSAMRLIGSLAEGETLPSSSASDGLLVLNGMVDSWQIERLMLFTTQPVAKDINGIPFTLNGQQSYTLGTGGTLNYPRPPRVDRYSIVVLNNPAQPLELPIDSLTDAEWQMIPVKNVSSALPTTVYNDLGFPFMTLSFWPIPNTAVQLILYIWVALSQFADLVTDYTFPPGYNEALRYNLALRLIAEYPGNYPAQVMQTVPALATAAISKIKSFNTPLSYLYCDPALVTPDKQVWNYLTGTSQPPGGR